MPVWLRRWSTASCTMARSSTSKDRHGGSKAVQSTPIWCHRQLPPPTAPKLPSTHSTALVDRRTRCVEHIVVEVVPVDGHHVPMPTRQENTNTSATISDLSTDARPETLWGMTPCSRRACTSLRLAHIPRATTTRSLRSLSSIQRPTIPVGPTLAPLYQFYPDLPHPAVPLLSRHSHQALDQGGDAQFSIRHLPTLATRASSHVQAILGDINSDEH